MGKPAFITALVLACIACASVYSANVGNPDGKGDRVQGATVSKSAASAPVPPIAYHGGPVMVGEIHLYYIWYGNWSGNTAQAILTDFGTNIGSSPYFQINTTYYQNSPSPQYVTGPVRFIASIADNYSQGTSLTDAGVQAIVSSAIASAALPNDSKGIYFVLTSADVNETSGFCTQYCGWHTFGFISNSNIKYSFIGNSDRCPSACAAQTISPNGNTGADGMISIMAHELSETVTDPDLNAWYDSSYQENGDKCAWNFGTTQTASNGSMYNIALGARQYLIQQMWLAGGGCAMSAPGVAPAPPTGLISTTN